DERPSRLPLHPAGDLPHGVVHALQTGVDAESSRRRELVGGVTTEQHPPLNEPFDDRRVELPESEGEDLGVEVVDADSGPYPVPSASAAEDVERPGLGRDGDLAEPATGAVERLQHAGRALVRDEEEDALPLAEATLDVGAEVAVDDVRQALRPFQ